MRAFCQNCKKWVKAPERFAGKKVACPRCRQPVQFEESDGDAVEPENLPGKPVEIRVVSPPAPTLPAGSAPRAVNRVIDRSRRLSLAIAAKLPGWKSAIVSAGQWCWSAVVPFLKEPARYYWVHWRILPSDWWQMGRVGSPFQNRELRFASSTFLESDTWEITLPCACVVCGQPAEGDEIVERRIVTAPHRLVHSLIGGALLGLVPAWHFGWKCYPIAILAGFWWGYRYRLEQAAVLRMHRCDNHTDDASYPELLLTSLRVADVEADARRGGLRFPQMFLIVRAGHARFRRFCERTERPVGAHDPEPELLRSRPSSIPLTMPLADDEPDTMPASDPTSVTSDPEWLPSLPLAEDGPPSDLAAGAVDPMPSFAAPGPSGEQIDRPGLRVDPAAAQAAADIATTESAEDFEPCLPWPESERPTADLTFAVARRLDNDETTFAEDGRRSAALCELVVRADRLTDIRTRNRSRRAFDALIGLGAEAVPGLCRLYKRAPACFDRSELRAVIVAHAGPSSASFLVDLLPEASDTPQALQIAARVVEWNDPESVHRLLDVAGRPQSTHAWHGCCSALIGSGHEVSLIDRWRAWFSGANGESPALLAEVLRRAVDFSGDSGTGCRVLCDLFADTLTSGILPDDDLWRGLTNRIGPDDADQLARLGAMTTAEVAHRLIVDRFCELDTPATRRQLVAGARSGLEPCRAYSLRALCHRTEAAQALPEVRAALATANDDDVAAIAQTLLAYGGDEAAGAILDAASGSEGPGRRVLWSVLAQSCPPSVAQRILEESLDASTSRVAALEVLGRFGPPTTPATVGPLLGDGSPTEVRQAAARALERHSRLTAPVYATSRPPDILSSLDEAFPLRLDDDEALPDIVARGDSGRFLLEAWFGPEGAAVPLVLALDDDDEAVRCFAAATVKNLGRLAEGVCHSLHESGPSRVRQALDQAWGLSVSRSQKGGV